MAANSPVRIGDDFFEAEDEPLQWVVTDQNREPFDITGWSIHFRLYDSQGGTNRVDKAATITSGTDGLVSVQLASADTAGLAGPRWYELSRTDSGFSRVLAYGDFEIRDR